MGSSKLKWTVLLLIAVGLLAPVWMVKYPPLLDYPNHLASSFVLAHLRNPSFKFDQFYGADWSVRPYLLMEVALVGLQRWVSVQTAGRILLSLCVLGLPWATWFFIRRANPESELNTVWALLAAYNPFLILGFVNLELGIVLCFLTLGIWMDFLARAKAWRWGVLLILVTLLYLTHLLAFAAAGAIVGFYSLFARLTWRRVLLSWALFVPGAWLYFVFSAGRIAVGHPVFRTLVDKALGLPFVFLGYSYALDIVTLLALAGTVGYLLYGNVDLRWNRAWLAVAAVLLALFLLAPAEIAGSDMDRRVIPFLFVVTLAAASFGRRARRMAVVVLVLFALRAVNVAYNFVAAQPRLTELAQSFAALPRGARVLPIVEKAQEERYNQASYMHFWAYAVIQRGCLEPYLFDRPDIHTLRLRASVYAPPGLFEFAYTRTPDWSRVQQDYQYVWAYNVPRFLPALSSLGNVVYQSGNLAVFQLKPKPSKTDEGP